MSNAAKYRRKAAEFEQLRQIDRAIASYVRAVEESEADGEEVDVALLNKVGDLALRQGRVADAVTYYERAVEHYATSGLFNNAIALCNKILRNAPGRSNVYFTLGRICARKKLRGDATRNFLEYATRMQQEGRIEEGIRALAEVVELMPELIEIRRLVDEHSARAGVALRRRTPAATTSQPASDGTLQVHKSPELVFLDIDYGQVPASWTTTPRPHVLRSVARTPIPASAPPTIRAEPVRGSDRVDLDLTQSHGNGQALHESSPRRATPSAPEGSARETPHQFALTSRNGAGDGPPPTGDSVVHPEAMREPFRLDPHDFVLQGELPPLVFDDILVELGLALSAASEPATPYEKLPAELHVPSQGRPQDAEQAGHAGPVSLSPMPTRATPATGVSLTPSLPIAAVAVEANVVAASRRDELALAVTQSPQDWGLRRRLAEALFEVGERDAALAELEVALTGFAQARDDATAADIADMLVAVSPERVPYHQRRVALAVRLQDTARLRIAYLDLADSLVRTGEETRARALYARVLEMHPADDRARMALGAALPTQPVAPQPQFLNLAEWLRDDAAPVSSRMRMPEPMATGDEQADFESLLRHFKEGVARSIGDDDFESRYDLGVAYKEMGLLDDAISEFQRALRSQAHRLPAYEALGQCFVEQGRFELAATVLTRALHEEGFGDEQRVGVLYLLAFSCEARQRFAEARSYFQRVYATDIHFRDVAARLAALDLMAS